MFSVHLSVMNNVKCAVAVERTESLETRLSPVYLQPLVMLMCSHTVLYSVVHCSAALYCSVLTFTVLDYGVHGSQSRIINNPLKKKV